MRVFRIEYRRRGARKWLTDPRRRFFTERKDAEQDIAHVDLEAWEVRIAETTEYEPDYRARVELEGRLEPSPWPATPAARWTAYLAGGRDAGRIALYDTFSEERADNFAQTIIDMLKGRLHPRAAYPAERR